MRTPLIILLLFLVALPVEGQQISRPPVGTTGPIGQGGSFPFFNSGTINMSDADYNMVYPDMSASVIRVTGALSATRNIIGPAGSLIGFEFTVINATTGGHNIVLKSAAGTGATIPPGQALMVVYDGTNYVSVGAAGTTGPSTGGFGNIVPSPFATIQAALSAGGGPVIVLPSSTDRTAYNNITNMRIQNYKQNPWGADSLFFRDVSEWGPIDGNVIGCSTTAGSNAISCGVQWVNAPAPAGDVGKLIIIPQAGAGTYGQVTGAITASRTGLTAGTPNTMQGITFTDAGDCYSNSDGTPNWSTQPYGHIQLDASGLPTGNVQFFNFTGKGCTHPPTRGTIATVGGTVTFTGGSMARGDLVSTIASVTAGTGNATLADNATYASGEVNAYYGTDAYQTLQSACNNVSTGGFLTNGTLTFSGMALISHGIDCSAAGLRILGRAPHGMASALIYAGKTPNNMMNGNVRATGGPSASAPLVPNAYVLNLAQGGAAKVERIHILGNSQAMPYGIMLSFGSTCYGPTGTTDCFQAPGSGSFIDQMHVIDQVTFGAFWGDPINDLGTPRLQSCVFWAGWTGNADFTMLDRIYCYGADTGMDSVNDQATDLKIGKWSSELTNIGMSTSGGIFVDDYYTEFNRADIVMGSPYWPGGFPEFTEFKNYGGESSAMDFGGMGSGAYNCYSLVFDNGALGGPSYYRRPDNISADFVNATPIGPPATSTCLGWVKWNGSSPANILIPNSFEGGPWNNMEFNGNFTTRQFRFPAGTCAGNCYATGGWGLSNNYIKINGFNLDFSVPNNTADWMTPYLTPTPGESYLSVNLPALLDVKPKSQITVGSLNLQGINWGSGPGIGYGTGPSQMCNGVGYPGPIGNPGTPCGSTTYQYQLTCSDSLGNESTPTPAYNTSPTTTVMVTNTGPSPLNSTNYNRVISWIRPGCDTYNLYGDNGVGGTIGFLASQQIGGFQQVIVFNDQGQWTKNTARVPPTVNGIGSLSVAGRLQLKTLLSAPSLGTDAQGNVIATAGGGPGGGGTVTSVGLTSANPALAITGSPVTTAGAINIDFTPQTATNVLVGPPLGANPVAPVILQSAVCTAPSTYPAVNCAFTNPTTAGSLIVVGMPRQHAGMNVQDDHAQTYSATANGFIPTYYKENSVAGVTGVTALFGAATGGAITILEIANVATSNSFDADIYNVGNITGAGTPITWGPITTTNPTDIVIGYWSCPVNSSTAPTSASLYTLGGYQAQASNGYSAGFVWRTVNSTGTYTPVVGTADCAGQQASLAIAFKANLVGSAAAPTFRPLRASDLPATPWSSIADPAPNALQQLDMNTGGSLWFFDINAESIPAPINGVGLGIIDTSTTNRYPGLTPGSQLSELFIQAAQPDVSPFSASATCGSSCAGMQIDGRNGNIQMFGNAGIQVPGTGPIVAQSAITSDTGMNAPAFNVCTTANPCTTPNPALAPLIGRGKTRAPTEAPLSNLPAPRTTGGGEPLASVHLHDFSTTTPTNGQVPIFNTALGVYVPGTPTSGASTINSLGAATAANTITNGNFQQSWRWNFTGATNGLALGEQTASAAAATVLLAYTVAGSKTTPFKATSGSTNGVQIDPANGNITALGNAKFVGPMQLTGLNSATSLATDATGNIIAGTGGGSGSPAWSSVTAGSNTTILQMSGSGIMQPAPASGFVVANFLAGATGDTGGINGNVTLKIPPFANGCLQYTAVSGLAWGSCGGGINPPYTLKAVTTGYNITADDFASCTVLTYSPSAAGTIYMPTTLPPAGECVKIINYSTFSLSINHSGFLVNGNSFATSVLPAVGGGSNLNPNGIMFISNGTGFNNERYITSAPFAGLQGGTSPINQTYSIANGSSVTPTGTGTVNANRINGAALPVSAAALATDANGTIIAGTGGGGGAGEYCHNYTAASASPGPSVAQSCVPTQPLVVGGHYRIVGSLTISATTTPMTPTFSINQGGTAGSILCDVTRAGGSLTASQSYYASYECEFTVTSATQAQSFGGSMAMSSAAAERVIAFPSVTPATISTSSPLSIDLVAQTLSTGAQVFTYNMVVYRVY